MSLFNIDSTKVDKNVSSLFATASGPRQRPTATADETKEEPEVDDEEISELEEDFDDEADVDELLEGLEDDQSASENESDDEGGKEGAPKPKKRKRREEDDMEAEDRYIQKLAEEKDDQEESEHSDDSEEETADKKPSKDTGIVPNAAEVEKAETTVFVGNVVSGVISNKSDYKAFKSEFAKCGKVNSIRFRSIAFSEMLPRKSAYIQQKLHESRSTVNAYVVFDTKEGCKAALKLNGHTFMDHHLRVDSVAHPAAQDAKRSVFIGNLDFEMEEEPLWKHFGPCGEIEYVRLIRDSKTNVGKGFGYVQFTDSVSVSKALLLDGKKIDMPKGRKLRVTRAKNIKKKPESSSNGPQSAKKPRLSNEDKTKLGRAKGMVGKAGKAQINQVIEGARAKVGDTVSGLNSRKKNKKPRIRARSTAFKKNNKA